MQEVEDVSNVDGVACFRTELYKPRDPSIDEPRTRFSHWVPSDSQCRTDHISPFVKADETGQSQPRSEKATATGHQAPPSGRHDRAGTLKSIHLRAEGSRSQEIVLWQDLDVWRIC